MNAGRFFRKMRREYPVEASCFGVAGGFLAAGAVGAIFMPALSAIMMVAALPTVVGLLSFQDTKYGGNSLELEDGRIIGDREHLHTINEMNSLVRSLTEGVPHIQPLPEEIEKRLLPHFEDVQQAIRQVRIHDRITGDLKDGVSFYRWVLNDKGRSENTLVALVTADAIILPSRQKQITAQEKQDVVSLASSLSPDALKVEFTQVHDRVESAVLEEREPEVAVKAKMIL